MEALGIHFSTVVSLRTRPDRLARFRAQGFGPSVVELLQEPHPTSGGEGCFLAHIAAWKEGDDRGWGPQAVFEDDAKWTAAAQDPLVIASARTSIQRIFEEHPTWDLIALGGIPSTWLGGLHEPFPGVIAAPFIESHAYVISPAFRRRALAATHSGEIDRWLSAQATLVFCLVPELVEQDFTTGSNINPTFNTLYYSNRRRLRSIGGALARACRPFPPRHIQVLLLVLCAFVLAVSTKPTTRRVAVMALIATTTLYVTDAFSQDHFLHRRLPLNSA